MGNPQDKVPWAAYADALAATLFVFILLALSFAYELQKKEAATQEDQKKAQEVSERDQRANRIVGDLQHAFAGDRQSDRREIGCLEKYGVVPFQHDRDGRISLYLRDGDLRIGWFPSGSARLSGPACEVASGIGQCLRESLETQGKNLDEFRVRVSVEGHTDSDPVVANASYYPSNWELSGARASAIVRAMMVKQGGCPQAGVNAEYLQLWMDQEQLEIVSVGHADRVPNWQQICEEERPSSFQTCDCLKNQPLGQCRLLFEPPPELSTREALIRWSNLDPQRKQIQRRVDLRFEVLPRANTLTSQP